MTALWRKPNVGAINTLALFWAGLVIGMAFIDATLKFHVPELSRVSAFALGKQAFTLLNKIELVFAAAVLALIVLRRSHITSKATKILFAVVLTILTVQTIWLMPILIERIDIIVAGKEPPASKLHIVYIALETIKVLGIFGLGLFASQRKQ